MLITGRTIEGNLPYLAILKRCAKTGILKTSLLLIKMDANLSINVLTVMDGRNKNSTLITLRWNNACMENNVKNLIALIITLKLIEDFLYPNGLNSFLKQEPFHFQQIFMFLYLVMWVLSTNKHHFQRWTPNSSVILLLYTIFNKNNKCKFNNNKWWYINNNSLNLFSKLFLICMDNLNNNQISSTPTFSKTLINRQIRMSYYSRIQAC